MGTHGYKAPEVFLDDFVYGPKIDVWCFGCVMVYVALRHSVFEHGGVTPINQLKEIGKKFGFTTKFGELVAAKLYKHYWEFPIQQPFLEIAEYLGPDVYDTIVGVSFLSRH